MCMSMLLRKKLVSSCESMCSFTITSAYINRWSIKPLLPSIFARWIRERLFSSRLKKELVIVFRGAGNALAPPSFSPARQEDFVSSHQYFFCLDKRVHYNLRLQVTILGESSRKKLTALVTRTKSTSTASKGRANNTAATCQADTSPSA